MKSYLFKNRVETKLVSRCWFQLAELRKFNISNSWKFLVRKKSRKIVDVCQIFSWNICWI